VLNVKGCGRRDEITDNEVAGSAFLAEETMAAKRAERDEPSSWSRAHVMEQGSGPFFKHRIKTWHC